MIPGDRNVIKEPQRIVGRIEHDRHIAEHVVHVVHRDLRASDEYAEGESFQTDLDGRGFLFIKCHDRFIIRGDLAVHRLGEVKRGLTEELAVFTVDRVVRSVGVDAGLDYVQLFPGINTVLAALRGQADALIQHQVVCGVDRIVFITEKNSRAALHDHVFAGGKRISLYRLRGDRGCVDLDVLIRIDAVAVRFRLNVRRAENDRIIRGADRVGLFLFGIRRRDDLAAGDVDVAVFRDDTVRAGRVQFAVQHQDAAGLRKYGGLSGGRYVKDAAVHIDASGINTFFTGCDLYDRVAGENAVRALDAHQVFGRGGDRCVIRRRDITGFRTDRRIDRALRIHGSILNTDVSVCENTIFRAFGCQFRAVLDFNRTGVDKNAAFRSSRRGDLCVRDLQIAVFKIDTVALAGRGHFVAVDHAAEPGVNAVILCALGNDRALFKRKISADEETRFLAFGGKIAVHVKAADPVDVDAVIRALERRAALEYYVNIVDIDPRVVIRAEDLRIVQRERPGRGIVNDLAVAVSVGSIQLSQTQRADPDVIPFDRFADPGVLRFIPLRVLYYCSFKHCAFRLVDRKLRRDRERAVDVERRIGRTERINFAVFFDFKIRRGDAVHLSLRGNVAFYNGEISDTGCSVPRLVCDKRTATDGDVLSYDRVVPAQRSQDAAGDVKIAVFAADAVARLRFIFVSCAGARKHTAVHEYGLLCPDAVSFTADGDLAFIGRSDPDAVGYGADAGAFDRGSVCVQSADLRDRYRPVGSDPVCAAVGNDLLVFGHNIKGPILGIDPRAVSAGGENVLVDDRDASVCVDAGSFSVKRQ